VEVVPRAETDEALLGARVPLGGETQRFAVGFELQQQLLGLGERDSEPRSASASSTPSADWSVTVARTARCAKASSSCARTPSVKWMN
jgi:hypothetical protein